MNASSTGGLILGILRIDTNRAALRVLEDWRGSYEGMRVLELGAGAGGSPDLGPVGMEWARKLGWIHL